MIPMPRLVLRQVVTHHVGPIDLTVEAGHCIGLHGPSGSGKTLLLRAVADLDPHKGEITLSEMSQNEIYPPLWRRRVAYFATESQWWGERVGDHFVAAGERCGEGGADEAALPLAPWLEQCGFEGDAVNWSVDRLSSGEKQRLAIVRHLILRPSVLLLDEPTSSLDQKNTLLCEQMLQRYQQQQGAVLIWVSHDMEQLQRVCSRQLQMVGGRVVESGQ